MLPATDECNLPTCRLSEALTSIIPATYWSKHSNEHRHLDADFVEWVRQSLVNNQQSAKYIPSRYFRINAYLQACWLPIYAVLCHRAMAHRTIDCHSIPLCIEDGTVKAVLLASSKHQPIINVLHSTSWISQFSAQSSAVFSTIATALRLPNKTINELNADVCKRAVSSLLHNRRINLTQANSLLAEIKQALDIKQIHYAQMTSTTMNACNLRLQCCEHFRLEQRFCADCPKTPKQLV
ncbi:hypothetical protein OE749_06890 [Aestuariibacter sp. AA17]|uniref:Ferric siderophore reductase C-terminal domain-containing protein n=1 Tax=Fluctibacter corallii TaxID=2984329 RepID=A0ABT3A7X1_9ALTE|nr:hypothetical protein [Aestuariibacter sp. AA17]MCV2884416.1 hypothetical protein [Aestuariibacter sp. AA17]